jgi:outer membrane receptor protein involved in Fe transport
VKSRLSVSILVFIACLAGTSLPAGETSGSAKGTATKDGESAAASESPNQSGVAVSESVRQASELSEELIYSVDRVPERAFETSRAVTVITITELWRRAGMNLADVLTREAGFTVINYNATPGVPLVRGLHGRQVMLLIDGVKVNDAMWRSASKEYLGLVDLSLVERVEIVRGVVSVLGTESLGGVINVITRKGPPGSETVGGSVGMRYSTADGAFRSPIMLYGQSEKTRWVAGGSYQKSDDAAAGGHIGDQPNTSYNAHGFFGSYQYLLSPEKVVSASYHHVDENDMMRAWQLAEGSSIKYDDGPAKLRLASLSYQDLTDRRFTDSIRATAYFNRQIDGRTEIRRASRNTENVAEETDNLFGVNLELGTFLASHHILYGVDATTETIHSDAYNVNLTTDAVTSVRGRYTDNAKYRTLGVYLQDRFNIGRWLTVTAGGRYGIFDASGEEDSSLGVITLDSRKGDFTGALNLVFHPTDNLNLIANAMRGFRAPNIDEISRLSVRAVGTDVPNPNAGPEHVNSYELGAKYESGRVSASAFYYNNSLTDLLTRQPGTFQGLSFFDQNRNGTKDANEPNIYQLQNLGTAKITGYEGEFQYAPAPWMSVSANITKTTGEDTMTDEPLDRIPPLYGNVTLTFSGASARRPWGQILFDCAAAQRSLGPGDLEDFRIGANGTDGYSVLSVRGGLTLAERLRLMVGVDNLTDEAYKTHDSWVYRPGRQLVLATEYRF